MTVQTCGASASNTDRAAPIPTLIRKTKDDAAVVPVPAFNEAQTKALAEYVRHRIEALVDILGGEVGSLQKLERERLDSELAAMRDTIEALRVEVQRLRGELVRQVTDSNVTILKGRADAA